LRSVGGSFQTSIAGQIFNEQSDTTGLTAYTSVLNRNDSNAHRFVLGRTRGSVAGAVTTLTNNDGIAQLMFAGADGTTVDPVAAQIIVNVDGTVSTGVVPGRITFQTASSAGTLTERMRIDSAGQVGIGSLTAAGYGILAGKNITGAVASYGMVIQGAIQSDVTSQSATFVSGVNTAAASFTLATLLHFSASGVSTAGAGSTITNQVGFRATSSMTGGTNNWGFHGAIPSGTGRFNLYMNGTADNYLAGRLGVGALNTSGAMAQITNTTAADAILVAKGAAGQSGDYFQLKNSAGVLNVFSVNANGNTNIQGNLEIGVNKTVDGDVYVDLIGDTTYTDYGLRILRASGANGNSAIYHRGTGGVYLVAQDAGVVAFNTNNTERMRIDSAGAVGIGGVPVAGRGLVISKTHTGSTTSIGVLASGIVQSDVTLDAIYYRAVASTAAAAFTVTALTLFDAVGVTTPGAGSTISTQTGFRVTSNMTGATNNYGFLSDIAAATGRWNFFANGTAANYMAGRLGVGATLTTGAMVQIVNTTAADDALLIKGAASQTGYLTEWQNSASTLLAYVAADGSSSFYEGDQNILAANIFS
jgi:hypothetical protein